MKFLTLTIISVKGREGYIVTQSDRDLVLYKCIMFISLTIISISGTEGYFVTQYDRDEVLVHNIWNASREQLMQLRNLNSEPFQSAASIIRTYLGLNVPLCTPAAIPSEDPIRAAFIVLREIKIIADLRLPTVSDSSKRK